jgi:hypothetical protein
MAGGTSIHRKRRVEHRNGELFQLHENGACRRPHGLSYSPSSRIHMFRNRTGL